MKNRITLIIVILCLVSLSCLPIAQIAIAAPTSVNMGSINIHGPTTDAYVSCSPINNQIKVGPNGNNITIQVGYSMDCPGSMDDGYCDISFVGGGGSDSRHTGGNDSGYMTISKSVHPGDSFTVQLHAKYTDWFGAKILGENTEYASATVVGVSLPVTQFSFSPSIPTKSDTVQFTDMSTSTDTTILSWSWNFGDGSSSMVQNPMHQYQNSGTYTVTLQVTDDYGQTVSKIEGITINARPVADFSYTPLTATTGDTIQFTDLSSDSDGSVASWSWDFGDGNSSIGKNTTHRYQKSGTYEVKLQVIDNNGTSSDTKITSITIKEKPLPGFEILIAICAMVLVVFWKRKLKKKNE